MQYPFEIAMMALGENPNGGSSDIPVANTTIDSREM